LSWPRIGQKFPKQFLYFIFKKVTLLNVELKKCWPAELHQSAQKKVNKNELENVLILLVTYFILILIYLILNNNGLDTMESHLTNDFNFVITKVTPAMTKHVINKANNCSLVFLSLSLFSYSHSLINSHSDAIRSEETQHSNRYDALVIDTKLQRQRYANLAFSVGQIDTNST